MNIETVQAYISSAISLTSAWEMLAVVFALVYLILVVKERIECWYFAFFSTAIYCFLFWDVDLLMESALQIYYLVMAVFGWWQWRRQSDSKDDLTIHTWSWRQHVIAISVVLMLTLISGSLLPMFTSAAWPYLDSFTTWGAVVTTYMVARKVLENWLYWVALDSLSVFLYIDRELYLTALLFIAYVIIVIFGFFQWLPLYRAQQVNEVK